MFFTFKTLLHEKLYKIILKMNATLAIKVMITLLVAVIIFHLAIVFKIIPYEITWGGRLQNDEEMYVFESISIFINFFLAFVLLIKGKYFNDLIPIKIINVILWIFVVLFGLNTIGNVFANTNFEKCFAVLTFASAILIGIILKKDQKQTHG